MKTIKTMSIIGIIFLCIAFLCIAFAQQKAIMFYGYFTYDKAPIDILAGWGLLSVFYSLALSIVCLINANRTIKKYANLKERNRAAELIELDDLRQKGILSEEEFQLMKSDILDLNSKKEIKRNPSTRTRHIHQHR